MYFSDKREIVTIQELDFVIYLSAREIQNKIRSIADEITDIVDSGLTLHSFVPTLQEYGPKSLEVCCLLNKPQARAFEVDVKYIAFTISDHFVIGYGLDFDGAGRNLPHIYQLIQQNY